MTVFFRLLKDRDKESSLCEASQKVRSGRSSDKNYLVDSSDFKKIPGLPFCYWISSGLINAFSNFNPFGSESRVATVTNQVGDDNRYYRAWWETTTPSQDCLEWVPMTKGGEYSPYYQDVHLQVAWNKKRGTYLGFIGTKHRPLEKPASADLFFKPGLTWPRRTQLFGVRILPQGCIFSNKGPAIILKNHSDNKSLAICALMNSKAFKALVSLRLNAADSTARSFEVGIIQETPFPELSNDHEKALSSLLEKAWRNKYKLDTITETSHAFVLPEIIQCKLGIYDRDKLNNEIDKVQDEIDKLAFDLYGLSDVDKGVFQNLEDVPESMPNDDSRIHQLNVNGLYSWCVGVVFGRFDLKLAVGDREIDERIGPFDPIPSKSSGMILNGDKPYHHNDGILVDDSGHSFDAVRLIEDVLGRVDMSTPDDLRKWLQKEFFDYHLKQYSKSRRKAPIYWPLSTASGSYTLWIYYPKLSSQTLYTTVNDFIEPKLLDAKNEIDSLKVKGVSRSRVEDRTYEKLQSLEDELIEMRDSILEIAKDYHPNHDDGVQITASPLWPLFRHKAWQKTLKETWKKLEKGDYDWAHLAISYWPDRVKEKCKKDKSLAIAHGLEDLYED